VATETEMFAILERIVAKTRDGTISWDESSLKRGNFSSNLGPYVLQMSAADIIRKPELVLKRADGKTVQILGGSDVFNYLTISSNRVNDCVSLLWKTITDNSKDVEEIKRLLT
jgi:hypothetical protein